MRWDATPKMKVCYSESDFSCPALLVDLSALQSCSTAMRWYCCLLVNDTIGTIQLSTISWTSAPTGCVRQFGSCPAYQVWWNLASLSIFVCSHMLWLTITHLHDWPACSFWWFATRGGLLDLVFRVSLERFRYWSVLLSRLKTLFHCNTIYIYTVECVTEKQ